MHGEFRWSKSAPVPTLEDVNLSVRKGELVGVLGRVGAGKVSPTAVTDSIPDCAHRRVYSLLSWATWFDRKAK